jgi:MraZ protein
MGYLGESHSAVDDKGRILFPVQCRTHAEHEDHLVWYLTGGFDGSVFVFPSEQWKALCAQIEHTATLDPEMMDFLRFFVGMAAKSRLDSQGRITVPATLREYAGIERDAVIIGVHDHLQLWSKESWNAFRQRQAGHYKAMATRLFGGKLGGAVPRATVETDHAD